VGFRHPLKYVDQVARDAAASASDAATNAQIVASSALNEALNGIIPGSRLSADAVNGKTINGATINGGTINGGTVNGATVRTATSGPRVEVTQSGSTGRARFYTGLTSPSFPTETYPGELWSRAVDFGAHRELVIDSGMGSDGAAGAALTLGVDPNNYARRQALLQAETVIVGDGLGTVAAGAVSLASDTSWLTLSTRTTPVAFALNGTPQVRRRNGDLEFRAGWASTGMATNTNYTIADLPAGIAPDVTRYGWAGTSSATALGRLVVGIDGTVQLTTGATLSNYYRLDPLVMPSA
jgi:hypothetical protein